MKSEVVASTEAPQRRRSSSQAPAIVLIDPGGAGGYPSEVYHKAGYAVIALITVPLDTLEDPEVARLAPQAHQLWPGDDESGFDWILLERDMTEAARVLRESPHDVRAVMPASESGVEYSDTLALALGLPSNDPLLAGARRDKALMKEAARRAGLRCAEFARCRSRADLDAFMLEHAYPVMVKTPSGGGSEFVYYVENSDELYASFDRVMAGVDRVSCRAPEFALIEECLHGTQYGVNLFGDGRDIHVTDIWSNKKHSLLMEPLYAPQFQALRDYAIELSKAVGIVRGPIFAEIMIDRSGPVMIEIAARMTGVGVPRLVKEFSNFDVYQASLEVFSTGTTQVPSEIQFSHALGVVLCISEVEGMFERFEGVDAIKNLPSYHRHVKCVAAGEAIHPTRDLYGHPMFVWLAHPNLAQVQHDAQEVHRLLSICVRGAAGPE